MENSLMDFGGLALLLSLWTPFVLRLAFEVAVLVVCLRGYAAGQGRGWLLLSVAAVLGVLGHLPQGYQNYVMARQGVAAYGRVVQFTSAIGFLLSLVIWPLTILGLLGLQRADPTDKRP